MSDIVAYINSQEASCLDANIKEASYDMRPEALSSHKIFRKTTRYNR